MLSEYPPEEDGNSEGGFMTPRDHARLFKSILIERLKNHGSPEACDALRSVRDAHPQYGWLTDVLIEARAAQRRMAWNPPESGEVVRLFANRALRIVSNGRQLLDVIIESLDRLSEELHGELPSRTNLWNALPGGVHRPKDEEHLSDTIARHLRNDLVDRGIVVNREVQIRRREVPDAVGGQPGQRTDIRVDVASNACSEDAEVIAAIIETKGNWHPDVRTAMQTQLVERYLRDNRCQTGLYIVGWYQSPAWDSTDSRRNQIAWSTQDIARLELANQAAGLTANEREVRSYVLNCALR